MDLLVPESAAMIPRPRWSFEDLGATAEEARIAEIIWLRYQIDVERYDRTLPGNWHPVAQEWIPLDASASRWFALKRRSIAREECVAAKISDPVMAHYENYVRRWSFEEQLQMLETMLGHPY